MNKSYLVAKYEFSKTVRRKEFILMTLGFPLFFIIIIFVPFVLAGMQSPEDMTLGYIDETGLFEFPAEIVPGQPLIDTDEITGEFKEDSLGSGPFNTKKALIGMVRYTDAGAAKQDMISGEISGYLVIPEDYIQNGIIESYFIGKGKDLPQRELSELMVNNLLQDRVDEEIILRVRDPINVRSFSVESTGEVREKGLSDLLEDFALPYITGILLLISIFTSSGYLLQGVSEEKESRVIEVLLSSITPTQMLTGKIIGLGAVGFVQIAIWFSVGFAGSFYFLALFINPFTLILAIVYFILGFLLFSSMMGGVGAISGSLRESQQFIPIFTFPAIAPILFMPVLIAKPDGIFSILLSMFPLTSPIAMLIRIGVSDVPAYQIAISILILAVSVIAVIIASARLFRVGLLMYGKRPRLGEIVRYMKTG